MFKKAVALIEGRVLYPRGILLRVSAFELFVFSALYVALFLVTGSVFVLGGAIACGVLSINHYRLARRHEAAGRSPC